MSAASIPHALDLEGPPAALNRWLADSDRDPPTARMRAAADGIGNEIFFNHVSPPRRLFGTDDDFDEDAFAEWRRKHYGFDYGVNFVSIERPTGRRVEFRFFVDTRGGDARPWVAAVAKRYPDITFTLMTSDGESSTVRTEYRNGIRAAEWSFAERPPHDAPGLLDLFETTTWYTDAIRWLNAELARDRSAAWLVRRARVTRINHAAHWYADKARRSLQAGAADLSEALQLAPDYGPAYAERARWPMRSLGDRIAEGRRAVELSPTDVTAWLELAQTLFDADRGVEAGEAVDRALALDAHVPEVHLLDQRREGRTLNQRIAAVARAVELNPFSELSAGMLGALHARAGRDEEAAVCFRRKQKHKTLFRFYNILYAGLVERLISRRLWDEALHACNDVMRCRKAYHGTDIIAHAHRLRANCHNGRGDPTAALADLEAVLTVEPDDWSALAAVLETHLSAGRLAVAKGFARAADVAAGRPLGATTWALYASWRMGAAELRQTVKVLRYWVKDRPPPSYVDDVLAMALCTLPRPTAADRAAADTLVKPLQTLAPKSNAALAAVHALHGRTAAAVAAQRRVVQAADDADHPAAQALLDHYRAGRPYSTFRL